MRPPALRGGRRTSTRCRPRQVCTPAARNPRVISSLSPLGILRWHRTRALVGCRSTLTLAAVALSLLLTVSECEAFSFWFSGGSVAGQSTITHPHGFSGAGGVLDIEIGIHPASPHAADMEIPVQNALDVWNALVPTTGNLSFGANNNVPSGFFDFESVVLHEVGHILGLDEPNLGSDSGLTGSATEYTNSETGTNGSFNFNSGVDGVIGSRDDQRGDDVNLNWFKKSDNNPFSANGSGIYDTTTYSPLLADLPAGDSYAANGSRNVAVLEGLSNTEAVMQQGIATDEAQRTLSEDDVAGIRVGMAGLDGIQGTPDDYTINLIYAGLTTSADVLIDFNNAASFAGTSGIGLLAGPGHKTVFATGISFNTGWNWFFNDIRLGETMLGDTDLDTDVDNTDILTAFTNFTGPGSFGKVRADGDVAPHPDGDGDVDVNDILLMFSEFTGPFDSAEPDPGGLQMPEEAGDPTIPDLIYHAATGEVILDPDGNTIHGYLLQSPAAGFVPGNFSPALGGVSTGSFSEISEAVFQDGAEGLTVATSIGNVFPTGLTLSGLNNLLGTMVVSVELGAPLVDFELVVVNAVPEPSTLTLVLLGAAVLSAASWRWPRKRR
ncbi:MAG: PEP-CTERM sorting domain-containing protein [Planctomycetota bacterium]|nr:MAG: PEP-CTERM sorting domain-containing protein [Planctomycetota bacterium]REK44260.1 MAG: PEP-CTERM sorting domain-containing protein [Planctomycetota bacterium]